MSGLHGQNLHGCWSSGQYAGLGPVERVAACCVLAAKPLEHEPVIVVRDLPGRSRGMS
jgi:hypothetical protein